MFGALRLDLLAANKIEMNKENLLDSSPTSHSVVVAWPFSVRKQN